MNKTVFATTKAILLGTACLLGTTAASAQTIPMERTPSGHYTVQVEISDFGQHTFILDTGASHTAIAQTVAEDLGFVSLWEEVDDVQALTERFEAERFRVEDINIAGLEATALNTVVIPQTPEDPRTVSGLLGPDILPAGNYRIDFTDQTLQVGTSGPRHEDGVFDQERQLMFATAEMGRGHMPINVLIDSGSAQTLVNPAMRAFVRRHWSGITINVGGVSGRIVHETEAVGLYGMQIGGVCFGHVTAVKADFDVFNGLGWGDTPSIILGLDVLSTVELTVDREAGVFEFGPGGTNPECNAERVQRRADDDEAM
jgi:predicted aspartyl protease